MKQDGITAISLGIGFTLLFLQIIIFIFKTNPTNNNYILENSKVIQIHTSKDKCKIVANVEDHYHFLEVNECPLIKIGDELKITLEVIR